MVSWTASKQNLNMAWQQKRHDGHYAAWFRKGELLGLPSPVWAVPMRHVRDVLDRPPPAEAAEWILATSSEHGARALDLRTPGVKGRILCDSQLEEVLAKACAEQWRDEGKLLEPVRLMDAEDAVKAYPADVEQVDQEDSPEEEDEPEEVADPPEEPDDLPEQDDTPLDEDVPNRDQVRILRRIHVNPGHPSKEDF